MWSRQYHMRVREAIQSNLNHWLIENRDTDVGRPCKDFSMTRNGVDVDVVFRDLEERLIGLIKQYPLIVGCVAWMTNHKILAALSEVPEGVSIVVQKEDFLRPEYGPHIPWDTREGRYDGGGAWGENIRQLYQSLKPLGTERGWILGGMSTNGDQSIDSVRCCGDAKSVRNASQMHNKFLVFCDFIPDSEDEGPWGTPVPKAVWTGSFNFTGRGTKSFENAVVIYDEEVAGAYFDEWRQILALSEELDWYSEYTRPQWRIGS